MENWSSYVDIKCVMILTHWGRMTHIYIGKLIIIGLDNGLSPGRRQALIWTNAGILLIRPLGTNFSEILIRIHTMSFKKMHSKMSVCEMASILSRPQCVKPDDLIMLETPKNSSIFCCEICGKLSTDFTHSLQDSFSGTYDYAIASETTLKYIDE